jgi:hypothetical protein
MFNLVFAKFQKLYYDQVWAFKGCSQFCNIPDHKMDYDQFESAVPPYDALVPRPVFPLHRVSWKGQLTPCWPFFLSATQKIHPIFPDFTISRT